MKYTLPASVLTLATIALQATAAVVDYASGEPISSFGYYQYHPTTFNTITKTKDCSYDGDDSTGDYKTVSHPEATYKTVYPDPPYITYHASGVDGTFSGSPAYQTVTAAPSWYSGSESECSAGPWIANPGFEDGFPSGGAWSGFEGLVMEFNSSDGSNWAAKLVSGTAAGDPWIEQAIIIPSGKTYSLTGAFRRSDGSNDGVIVLTVSLHWDTSETTFVSRISPGASIWFARDFPLGEVISPSQCVPAVLHISMSVEDEGDVTENKALLVDSFALSLD